MSKNLRKCLPVLSVIAKIKNNKTRKEILKDLRKDENMYKALKEIAINILNKNLKINRKQKVKLSGSAKLLHNFNKKHNSKLNRQRLVVQSGGILPIIIPAAISLLSTILSNAVRGKG